LKQAAVHPPSPANRWRWTAASAGWTAKRSTSSSAATATAAWPCRASVTAREGADVVGTLSVRFDGDGGLHADLLFGAELDEWRAAGLKLCEFGGLAMDKHSRDPRRALAHIFHLAYLHAHRRARCDRLVIEVNPRHVGFYRRCLGLVPMTAARHNPRVNAPAVLMSIAFADVREQIALWGGRADAVASARSLYPLFWGEATEATMLARLP